MKTAFLEKSITALYKSVCPEATLSESTNPAEHPETLPPVSSLPPGKYLGLHYSLVFEMADGRKFRTPWGPKCSKIFSKWDWAEVTPEGEFRGCPAPGESAVYDPPMSLEEMRAKLDPETFNKLSNDPVHWWRAESGIELIHKEPSLEEFDRICANWEAMTPEQKKLSDEKSMELFGAGNRARMPYLRFEYELGPGVRVKVRDNLRCRQSGEPGKIMYVSGPDEHGWDNYTVEFDDPSMGKMSFSSGELEKI